MRILFESQSVGKTLLIQANILVYFIKPINSNKFDYI